MICGHHLEAVVANELAPSVRWLQKQIRAGRVSARKLGRHWVMTDRDIEEMLETFKNRANVTEIHPTGGLSAASMRRRAS